MNYKRKLLFFLKALLENALFQGDITWVFVPTAQETKCVIEGGENGVTNGLH